MLDIIQLVKMNSSQCFRFVHMSSPFSSSRPMLSLVENALMKERQIIHIKNTCYISTVLGKCQEFSFENTFSLAVQSVTY